jgi:hypothetical protein
MASLDPNYSPEHLQGHTVNHPTCNSNSSSTSAPKTGPLPQYGPFAPLVSSPITTPYVNQTPYTTLALLWLSLECCGYLLYCCGYLLRIAVFHLGRSCTVCFNLYCDGFILFCNVCVCVRVYVCGFCNVCVCVGFVICGCLCNMYTVL